MSEESITRFTKNREGKRLKAKNGLPGTGCPENSHQRLDTSSIVKPDLMKDSVLTRRAEDQPPSNMPGKMKISRKRKRTDCDVPLDASVNAETDATELEPQKNIKRDEDRKVSDIENMIEWP